MYLCQNLIQQTDRHYRADWRVMIYRVELTAEGKLRWVLHRKTGWRGSGWWGRDGSGRLWRNGKVRAEKDLLKNVPIINAVFHGKKVTGQEAEKLTNLRNPCGLDRLMEAGSELTDEMVCNYIPTKTKPKLSKLEESESKKFRAASRVEEIDRKIRRLETLRKKWARREKFYVSRTEKLSQTEELK